MDKDELRAADAVKSSPPKDVQELKPAKITEQSTLGHDFEELKSKISFMDSKLKEVSTFSFSFLCLYHLRFKFNETIMREQALIS